MKHFLHSFFILITINTVLANPIERNLQAVITNADYPQALADAQAAVERVGSGYLLTLAETSRLKIDGPKYYFYIPVFAVRVPLSPEKPQKVGSIVAHLLPGLNSPLPAVEAVYFKPAASPAL